VYSQTEIRDAAGNLVSIDVYAPVDEAVTGEPLTRVVFLQGANCSSERYSWLGKALATAGCLVLIPNAPVLEEPHPVERDKVMVRQFASHDQFQRVLALLEAAGDRFSYDMWLSDRLIIGGHSAGAGVILEELIPSEMRGNPIAHWSDAFQPPRVDGAFVLGSHLQAEAMGRRIPWRDDDWPLQNESGAPILFLAGELDGMATPAKMRRTFERVSAPAFYVEQSGANHFGWTEGLGRHDRVDLDLRARLAPDEQHRRTAAWIAAFIRGIRAGSPQAGFATMAADAQEWGDQMEMKLVS
jgi:pimeloyl-ACP methyl ester carboxylesterase